MPSGGQNRLTREIVIEQFKEVHGDEFDYSNVVYINTNTPVEVRCKKHNFIFTPTPKNHKNGAKCTICGREAQMQKARKSNEQFEKDIIEKYGDIYDFSLVEYINTKTPVKLIHKEFGLVEVRPDTLLSQFVYIHKSKKKTKSNDKETFITEAVKVYGDKDDYTNTNVISSKHNIDIRCKKHDITFNKNIQTYLGGWGCPSCSAENYRELRAIPKDEYYRRANEKHDNKYKYIDDYTTLNGVITFICEEHGKQRKNAGSHMNGYGCKKCNIAPIKVNKRSKEGYCKLADGRSTMLYILKCFNENEEFFKIGKTFRKITKRYINSNMPYNIKVIYKYENSADFIWDLEEGLHKKYKEYKYKPRQWFAGYSEAYKLNLPIEQIIKETVCQKE